MPPALNIHALLVGVISVMAGLFVLTALRMPQRLSADHLIASALILLWRVAIVLASLMLCLIGIVHIFWAFPPGPQF